MSSKSLQVVNAKILGKRENKTIQKALTKTVPDYINKICRSKESRARGKVINESP